MTKEMEQYQQFGQVFRSRRLELDLDIDDVSKTTRISGKYLRAIEEGFKDQLPEFVYTKNFIYSYGLCLGFLGKNDAMEEYLNALIYWENQEEQSRNALLPRHVGTGSFVDVPKIMKIFVAVVLVGGLVWYLGWQVKKIFDPPALEVLAPEENALVWDTEIEIQGRTAPEAEIKINGSDVLGDESGYFQKKIDLRDGLNVILVTAQKKHSRQASVERRIVVQSSGKNALSIFPSIVYIY